jgi:hypothetical protein
VQVVHEWNTVAHIQGNEADPTKRAFTKKELHAFFAHCDDQVARIRAFGRKGWLPAFRDAVQDRLRVRPVLRGSVPCGGGRFLRVCAARRLM